MIAKARRVARLLGRLETRMLFALAAAAAAVWAVVTLAGEMQEGETHAVDRQLLLALRTPGDPSQPLGSRSFQEAMRDVTALGGFTVLTLVTVVATIGFLLHRKFRHAATLALTVLLAQLGSRLLKELYGRPRPDLVPHAAYVYTGSFPSGHSMLSAATYLTLATLLASLEPKPGAKALTFVVAIMVMAAVGMSRVYLGVHWPSDVLAGWCAGALCALLAWAALWWSRSAPRTPPRPGP
jgi:undecaprenyl-diphosphatase